MPLRHPSGQQVVTDRTRDRAAVEALPARSSDELLRAKPGLHPSAHGGHGRAYPSFFRGLDAVHAADLAVEVDDVRLEELSNVHTHGSLDLRFIPTALVRSMELHPGAWQPDAGDVAFAGSASYSLGLDEAGGTVCVGVRLAGTRTSPMPRSSPSGSAVPEEAVHRVHPGVEGPVLDGGL